MFTCCTDHGSAASTFSSSAAVPHFDDEHHPRLLWQTKGATWQSSFLQNPRCVGLGYLDSSFAVRILSAPSFYGTPGYGEDLLVGSDGSSALEARPIAVPFSNILCKGLCIVPRRDLVKAPIATSLTPLILHIPQDMLGSPHALAD